MSVLSSKIPVEMQYSIRDGLKKFFEQYHPLTDSTQKYVWGKEVRLSFSSKPTFVTKIESWHIDVQIDPHSGFVHQLMDIVRKCRRWEVLAAGKSGYKNPLICELEDWLPLEDEKGKLIRSTNIGSEYSMVMVKYAAVIDADMLEEAEY